MAEPAPSGDADSTVTTQISEPSTTRKGLGGRAGWSIVDQGLSSVTNVLVTFAVARSVDQFEFGSFATGFMAYVVILNLSRSFASQPLVIRFSSVDAAEHRRACRAAVSTALAFGCLFGVPLVAYGYIRDEPLGWVLAALGIMLPGLLVQDALRFCFTSGGIPKWAAIVDFTWLVAIGVGVTVLTVNEVTEGSTWLFVWGVGAAAAAILGSLRLGLIPSFGEVVGWIEDHLDLGPFLAGDYLLTAILSSAAVLILSAVTEQTRADVGTFTGAQQLVGPAFILLVGLSLFVVPEGARIWKRSPERLAPMMGLASAAVVVAFVLFSAVILALPSSVGVQLLGDTWAPARAVLIWFCLRVVGEGLAFGATSGLQVLGRARTLLVTRAAITAPTLALAVYGAWDDGLAGFVMWIAFARLVAAGVWWLTFLKAQRQSRGQSDEAATLMAGGVGTSSSPAGPSARRADAGPDAET